ncbi:MAG: MFS transporter [Lachnospiraceae bacterium]|nr:MFS transporter [Lachnospiraceae bacterium]
MCLNIISGGIGIFQFSKLNKEFNSSVKYLNRLNRNIIIFIIYGLLYDTAINIYKPLAVKYLERLGGSNLQITLYNCLPGFVGAAVLLPGLFYLLKVEKKKAVTCVFIFISRFILLLIAFVPMLPNELRPIAFVLLISAMNFPEAVSQASMQSFSGDLFDGRVRATAFSLRNKFGNLLILIVTLVSGMIISYIPKSEAGIMLCYRIFFATAFIVGLGEVFYFSKLKEEYNPKYSPEKVQGKINIKISDIKEAFHNKAFVSFGVCTLLYYISYHSGWAVSSIYVIKNLGANEIWLAIISVTSGLSSFLFASRWNRIIVKKGNNIALTAACLTMAINTLFLVMSPNLYFLIIQSMVNGIGVIGLNITLLNGLLINTPDKNRLLYIGLYNTFMNLSLGFSPLFIQFFMDHTSVKAALSLVAIMRFVSTAIVFYVAVIRNKNKPVVEA